jgi:flagellar biosynthesis GTPase FlhF
MNSAESSYQQGELMEEDQKCILIIGGIQIFLPISPVEASTSVAHEEVVQQESKKEAMRPNDFKANCVCDAGTTEERQLARTVKEEEEEKTLMSAPTEKEENSDEFLTQWEQELKMLEDWLDNPKREDGHARRQSCRLQEKRIQLELLKNSSRELNRR